MSFSEVSIERLGSDLADCLEVAKESEITMGVCGQARNEVLTLKVIL